MADVLLDDFHGVSAWLPVASGLARLAIARDAGPRGGAIRLGFDFASGSGFVVARRDLPVAVPETFALRFESRGTGPRNRLEPPWHVLGVLGFTLRRTGERAIALRGDLVPPGGVVLRPPLWAPLACVEIAATATRPVDADSVTVPASPADIVRM